MKVLLQTFGCQMNKLDSAIVESSLRDAGCQFVDNVKDTDVVLINTCSVRDHAEQRVLSHLGHLKHIKESKPELIVGVIGCMAQRLGEKLLEQEAVDIVCGPAQIPQIVKIIEETLQKKQKTIVITQNIRKKANIEQNQALDDFESAFDTNKAIPAQAYVRVMHGCDKFCSYCIVPYVRGPEISRPVGVIIEQIKRLADEGVKQITLLGQRVNAYNYKQDGKLYCLADLLYMVSDIAGIEWIRFVTSYPSKKFYDEILRAMVDLPKVCKYLHIPAQSGSDKILRAMNRHYTAAEYLELLAKAKDTMPDIALSGDFMVGFPGETQEDFEATVDLVKKARYKNCFVFRYSPRPGTAADDKLQDDIPQDVKKRRNMELLTVQEKISAELSRQFLGKKVTVLVEGLSKKPHLDSAKGDYPPSLKLRRTSPQLVGRTAADWIVVFNGPENLAGQFLTVKITKTSPLTLFGEIS